MKQRMKNPFNAEFLLKHRNIHHQTPTKQGATETNYGPLPATRLNGGRKIGGLVLLEVMLLRWLLSLYACSRGTTALGSVELILRCAVFFPSDTL